MSIGIKNQIRPSMKSGGADSAWKDVESTEHLLQGTATDEVTDKITVVVNTLNALFGAALFAMPWGFQQSGVIGGTMVLVVVSALSYETARILLVAQKVYFQQTGEIKGYPEIASAALGPLWFYVVQITTVISCLGGCIGYIIFFGQTLGQTFNVSSDTVILYATIPLVLLSWIRSFHELTIMTIFGLVALLFSVVVLIIDGGLKTEQVSSTPLVIGDTVLNFVGSATFLFTIHYCVLAIGAESLRNKPWLAHHAHSPAGQAAFVGLESAIALSYVLAFLVILLVGSVGYVMYRNVELVKDEEGGVLEGCEQSVCQNIVLNITPGVLSNIVGLAMSVVIIFSYLIILAPAREHIENSMISLIKPVDATLRTISQNIVRTALVLFTVFVALCAPYFGSTLSAVGGLTDAFLCFVMPPLIFRVAQRGELGPFVSTIYLSIVGWGAVVIGYTLNSAIGMSAMSIAATGLGVGIVITCVDYGTKKYHHTKMSTLSHSTFIEEKVWKVLWASSLKPCAFAALAFEVLRMIIAYVLARPSSKVIQLECDKYDAMAEVGKIRSVQLEFVKHSKLTRKVIALEKEIETLQAQYFPRLLKVRKVFRVLRFVVYIAIGVYLGARPVLQINPLIMWPLSWFTSLEVISIYPWFVLFVMGGMIRHVLRSVLPIVFSSTSFP